MISFTIPGQAVGKGRGHKKASDEQIAQAYVAVGSCKGAAALLGMCKQSVHERLCRLGINNKVDAMSDDDKARLVRDHQFYADSGRLNELAVLLGRRKTSLCKLAKKLGLTNQRRLRPYLSESTSAAAKERIAINGHPKGMLGKKHSAESRARMSYTSRQRWERMTADERSAYTLNMMKAKAAVGSLAHERPSATWKAGWREVGGRRIYFRSRWEANYGRYLEWLRSIGNLAAWEHEPEVFWFEKIKRGCRSYLPDFKVTENDGRFVFHEVKGWMDDRSKTKINRMRIYHPEVKLIVIEAKHYREIVNKVSNLIQGWES